MVLREHGRRLFLAGLLLALLAVAAREPDGTLAMAVRDGFPSGEVRSTQPARSFGILQGDGRLVWPQAFRDLTPQHDAHRLRVRIQQGAREALRQAQFGVVEPGTLHHLTVDVTELAQLLKQKVTELPFNHYIEAKRFLANLNEAIQLLRQSKTSTSSLRK
jgi:hypothetical protein